MKFERKEKDDYIQIEAIDNNEIVGFINYKFKRSGKVWLNNIVVNKGDTFKRIALYDTPILSIAKLYVRL